MEKDKIIILALIVIIVALLVGVITMMQNGNKQDTKLIFRSNDTIDEGGYVKIKLTDANGTELANQTVNITVTDEDNSNSYYSVVTDEDGDGKIKLDKDAGEYTVTITYGGNDSYGGCNVTQKLTIKEGEKETQETSNTNYEQNSPKLEFNGKTHEQNVQEAKESRDKGGQMAGLSDEEIERMVSKEEREGGRP